jgi:hypothetical protein
VSDNHRRSIKASELSDFLYCHRAWAFQREEAPSAREPERQAGTAYHVRHGDKVAAGERTGALSRAMLLVGVALLLLGLLAALL